MSRVYLSQARMLNTRGVPELESGVGSRETRDEERVISIVYGVGDGE